MKRIIILSAVAAAIVCGATTLAANEELSDSVAKKDVAALANPQMTEGEHAAKAKVEEEREKKNFDTKMDRSNFKKEAAADEKKVDDIAEVKELEAKDKAAASTKTKVFKKESATDEKKTVK